MYSTSEGGGGDAMDSLQGRWGYDVTLGHPATAAPACFSGAAPAKPAKKSSFKFYLRYPIKYAGLVSERACDAFQRRVLMLIFIHISLFAHAFNRVALWLLSTPTLTPLILPVNCMSRIVFLFYFFGVGKSSRNLFSIQTH